MSKGMSIVEAHRCAESLRMFNEEIGKVHTFKVEESSDDLSDEEGTPSEKLGAQTDVEHALDSDGGCGPVENRDLVDDAIEEVIVRLVNAGYSDEDAEDAAFEGIESLIADEAAVDTPDMDATREEKALWVSNTIPKLLVRLKEMGLDFE